MLALIALALQSAAPAPAPPPTPATPVAPAAPVVPVPAPMRYEAWKAMTQQQRIDYASVTIQGLRRNPVLARCQALEAAALAAGIDREAHEGDLLIMAVASATYRLCPIS